MTAGVMTAGVIAAGVMTAGVMIAGVMTAGTIATVTTANAAATTAVTATVAVAAVVAPTEVCPGATTGTKTVARTWLTLVGASNCKASHRLLNVVWLMAQVLSHSRRLQRWPHQPRKQPRRALQPL